MRNSTRKPGILSYIWLSIILTAVPVGVVLVIYGILYLAFTLGYQYGTWIGGL